jgi:hypothetical protein
MVNDNYNEIKDIKEEIDNKNNFKTIYFRELEKLNGYINKQCNEQFKNIYEKIFNNRNKIEENSNDEIKNLELKIENIFKEQNLKIEITINNFLYLKEKILFEKNKIENSEIKQKIDNLKEEINKLKNDSDKSENTINNLKEFTNNQINKLYENQENLMIECEKLRIDLDQKIKQTISINNEIQKLNSYINLIEKYGNNYLIISEKENSLKQNQKNFDKDFNEFKDLIERIEIFYKKFTEKQKILKDNINIFHEYNLNEKEKDKETILKYLNINLNLLKEVNPNNNNDKLNNEMEYFINEINKFK